MNFILKDDTLLTLEECDNVIQWVYDNKKFITENRYTGYHYCNLKNRRDSWTESFSNISLQPIDRAITKLVNSYIKEYPEITNLATWNVEYVRFKWWKPGDYYSIWHSEHSKPQPYRVLSFLIYLSDNDAETQFKRYENVESKAGRGIIFPSYFTHEHMGSPCKRGVDRYVVSGYCSFV